MFIPDFYHLFCFYCCLNLLSICQNFEKRQAISNMGLPRHIEQIALAHGG